MDERHDHIRPPTFDAHPLNTSGAELSERLMRAMTEPTLEQIPNEALREQHEREHGPVSLEDGDWYCKCGRIVQCDHTESELSFEKPIRKADESRG